MLNTAERFLMTATIMTFILLALCVSACIPPSQNRVKPTTTPSEIARSDSPIAIPSPIVSTPPLSQRSPTPSELGTGNRSTGYKFQITGRVIGVIDGDTVDILDDSNKKIRIRLAGIDAPEKSQPFAGRSKENLVSLTFNRFVTVAYSKLDRNKRIIGKILVGDEDICLEQIRDGYAWHFKRYSSEQPKNDRDLYAEVENDAQTQGKGIWSEPSPVAPWVYRTQR